MARSASPTISALEDALAALSYVPETLARLVRRSRHHLTAQDLEDLLAIAEHVERTKRYLGEVRAVESKAYQEGTSR